VRRRTSGFPPGSDVERPAATASFNAGGVVSEDVSEEWSDSVDAAFVVVSLAASPELVVLPSADAGAVLPW
jgi:hypothetical protein